jgi:hypothetical protein
MLTVGMDVHVRNSYLSVSNAAGQALKRGRVLKVWLRSRRGMVGWSSEAQDFAGGCERRARPREGTLCATPRTDRVGPKPRGNPRPALTVSRPTRPARQGRDPGRTEGR